MTTNKDFRDFQKFLSEQKQVKEGLVGTALKSAGKMTAATSALSGGIAAGQTAAQGGSKDDVVKAGIEGAKSVVTEPVRKYKQGDKWGAAADVLSTATPAGAAAEIGKYAAQTDIGRSVGKWIGDNVPGAKAAADAAKKVRDYIGMKSSWEPEEPKQDSTPETPQQTSSSDEIVPRKVKTTVEKESGGQKIKSFKQFNKNK
jgi:hypothetical protein